MCPSTPRSESIPARTAEGPGEQFVSELGLRDGGLAAQAAPARKIPTFEVDKGWPKVPAQFKVGDVSSIAIDANDNAYVLSRPRTLKPADAPKKSPPVMVFDPNGNYVKGWGGDGAGYEWPQREHGILVDAKGFVWLGGNSCPENGLPGLKRVADDQLLKFTQDGKFVMQVGKKGARLRAGAARPINDPNSLDMESFGQPTKIVVDAKTNEAYVSDGYVNHRVVVFDSKTGAYKRHWGAFGTRTPTDEKLPAYSPAAEPSKSFSNPVHCVRISNDGLVYVCDRANNRIQVFRKDGTYVKEFVVEKETLANGAVWDLVLSEDPQQRFIFMADGNNGQIVTLLRENGQVLSQWGRHGRQPGQFKWVHNIAIDSKGTLYTAEVGWGRRVQKFRRVE